MLNPYVPYPVRIDDIEIATEDKSLKTFTFVFLNKEDDYIFSFQAICSYLDINPERVLVVVGLTEDQKLKPGDKPYHPNNANPTQPDQANKTASSAPE